VEQFTAASCFAGDLHEMAVAEAVAVSVRLGLPLSSGHWNNTQHLCRNSPNGRKATLLFGTTGPWPTMPGADRECNRMC
jgi:hypothetical protein